ncbi:acyltransferase family protein [Luteipulveratus mongoliensis]|uniref:Acyltransferase 3 domain-containing protein n=1 Tax=Luteipulveratus mongoliensis TaxID=571913 RepID=A0A0K1JJ81_9MICO|nr:acyltransferase family protein [Luteipulveratus mongoliensis]AKU16774.1 hypothetical protein VV02_14350 [Luteipulveratus mongoliensis]
MSSLTTRRDLNAARAQRYAAIDGYRGLFISLVLLYHAGVSALAGGWIGINHFFVFSGFLIARLLIREQQRTGTIRALEFYRRRVRRIVPAMLILVGAVVVHTWLTQEAEQRSQFGGDAFATLGFFLNWRLIGRDDAYFDMFGHPSPLRHAWTLSVEEQFYVLAPFLILAVCWLTRKRLRRAAVPVGLALLSAWWTAHLGLHSLADYPRLYYGTDTRAQALLVGVAVAFVLGVGSDGRPPARLSRGAVEGIAWTGMLVSISALFILDEDTPWAFNNGGMLVFAIAAGLIGFAAVDDRNLLINRVFSWAPLAYLGRISYGLYLYHWPIILWLPLNGLPRVVAGAIQLGLTLVVASLSFRFVEAPILLHGLRGLFRRRTTRRLLPVGLIAVLTAGSMVLWTTKAPALSEVPTLVAGQAAYKGNGQTVGTTLVGDSVAASLAAGWTPGSYPDVRLENQSAIGCDLMTVPVLRDGQTQKEDEKCTAWKSHWPAVVREKSDRTVLLVADTHFLTTHQGPDGPATPQSPALAKLIGSALDHAWAQAKASGATRISVLNLPCRRIDPQRLDPSLRFFAAEGSNDRAVTWANGVIADWVRKTSGAQLLDLHAQLCTDGYRPSIRGVNLYHDTLHFSPQAAAMIWTWITPRIRDHSLA